MIICDICKRERPCTKIVLPYTFECRAFQTKEYDICSHCKEILALRETITKISFINNNPEQKTLQSLHIELPLHAEKGGKQ